jgi:RNA polymerase sigma-70 factor (ECF subfamily)
MTHASLPTQDLFQTHADEVYGWAFRVLGRHEDALDVVQDVYLKWSQQCADEPPQQVRGWLRRVTINRAIDVQRGARSAMDVDDEAIAATEKGSQRGTSMADHLDQELLRADVAVALASLTEPQRLVLVAKVYDELTFAAIAAELSLAVSTVKTHYLRALQALRERLHPRWATAP